MYDFVSGTAVVQVLDLITCVVKDSNINTFYLPMSSNIMIKNPKQTNTDIKQIYG